MHFIPGKESNVFYTFITTNRCQETLQNLRVLTALRMEILRQCESPIEMNSFGGANDKRASSPEREAMLPANEKENSVHNNNSHRPITAPGKYK